MSWQSNTGEKEFILPHSSKPWSIIAGKLRQQSDCICAYAKFASSFFTWFKTGTQGMVLPMFGQGHLTSINAIKTIPPQTCPWANVI